MACDCLTLIGGALVLLVFYLVSKYTYWKRQGIPTATGLVPLLGHMWPLFTLKCSYSMLSHEIYTNFKDKSMIGLYKLTTPVLLVREPQLVKTVLQSNFSSFHENGVKIEPDIDPLLAKSPFFSYGDIWMTGRKRMTYAFSSMRLKILFQAVDGVCEKLKDFLNRRLKSNNRYEVDLKCLFTKFTGEVVANAGLGIEGHCFEDETHPLAFDQIGKKIFELSLFGTFLSNIIFFIPEINKILKFNFIPKHIDKLFREVVEENMEVRRKETTPRNDFFQLMVELEKVEGNNMDVEILAAHALTFYFDGLETSALTLTFIGYYLAVHEDVQSKVREEVHSVIAKHDGVLTYEALREMTYMDQVINESQRFFPGLAFMSKICKEEFELQGSDGLTYRVKPGTEVVISLFGLHLDPKYWDNPEEFDPERFNEDRKKNIEKMTFLPFGEGPRMCVGMRMALLQMKACLSTLLKDYKLELSPKTQQPLKVSPTHFLTAPAGGVWAYISKV